MDLVFIYGPPAVGKLTVARHVSDSTGFKLLHNHLAFDIAAALFEPFSAPFVRLLQQVRLLGIRAGVSADIPGLVMTMCYDHPRDRGVVEELHAEVLGGGGKVHYVRLECAREELRRRVASPDRGKYRKLTRPEKLDEVLGRWELFTSVEGHPSLVIDNTDMAPESAAERIVEHYGIRPCRKKASAT